jgi:predicted lactoylglutathione lyase
MTRKVFINLAVTDLDRAKAFFTALGYGFNPTFTDANAACMVVSESIHVMLLTRPFFQGFTPKALCDAHAATEVLICLDADSRAAVDELVAKAVSAGARTPNPPQDHGFMYQHGFEDLDGHLWELVHMSGDPPQ